MTRVPALVAAGLFAVLTTLSVASAAPGDLDSTFAGKGWLRSSQFFQYQEYQPKGAEDLARQADGKIVLTGEFLEYGWDWQFGAGPQCPPGYVRTYDEDRLRH